MKRANLKTVVLIQISKTFRMTERERERMGDVKRYEKLWA